MSILDDLIKIKTCAQDDDLIKMLDEIPVYEKLSVNEQFKDLKSSAITRSKCPMLAAFADGNAYETILGELIANIYLHIENDIPDMFHTVIERTPKEQKQFEILQQSLIRITYHMLSEYDHELMKDRIAAVFTNRRDMTTVLVIILRDQNEYDMYHGCYDTNGKEYVYTLMLEPVVVRGNKGVFTMASYSVLGNNGYPFGCYMMDNEDYGTMIGPDGELFLTKGDGTFLQYHIPDEKRNLLATSKNDAKDFANAVLLTIESVV